MDNQIRTGRQERGMESILANIHICLACWTPKLIALQKDLSKHLLISNLREMGREEQIKEVLIEITQHSNSQRLPHKSFWVSASQPQP